MDRNLPEYIVLCGQIVGGNGRPFETIYGFDGERFHYRSQAITHGLRERGSDDFNIGVIKNGKLVSLDWMNEVGDTDPAILAPIAKQIGLIS